MFINAGRSAYQQSDRDQIGMVHAAEVRRLLDQCPAHQPTPLAPLPAMAVELGIASVHIKGEWARMGLYSFKALGGAYAVALQVMASPEAARDMTFVCASAGNHGLSVAASAHVFGAASVVFLCESVAERFADRLRAKGAEVRRAGANYEESMAAAVAAADANGWGLISDSSWPGYRQTALEVMRGYTVLLNEAAEVMEASGGPATHVFVQAGIGGLAGAAAGYLRDRWGEGFKLIVVEPEGAPCLLGSVRQGYPGRIAGSPTILGRLDCEEPSLIAYELLSRLADAFMLVSDAQAEAASLSLIGQGAPASPCGATGAAGLVALGGDADVRQQMGLDADARVLLVGTEASDDYIAATGP